MIISCAVCLVILIVFATLLVTAAIACAKRRRGHMSPAPPTELQTREETHHEISRRSWGLENEIYVQMNGASCIRLEDL